MTVVEDPTRSSSQIQWRLYAAFVALALAVYRYFTAPTAGDSVFAIVIAILIILSEKKVQRSDLTINLRHMFAYGDRIARYLMIALAVGGSALIIKEFFGLNLLPDWLDYWVKRGGVGLVGVASSIYLGSIISKIIFSLSFREKDKPIRVFEMELYALILIFSFTFMMANLGCGFWDSAVTSKVVQTAVAPDEPDDLGRGDAKSKSVNLPQYTWQLPVLKMWFCGSAVSFIWIICFSSCVFSRFAEVKLRDGALSKQKRKSKIGPKAENGDITPELLSESAESTAA